MTQSTVTTEKKPLLSSQVYDFLKNVALVYLPAFGAAYFSLSGIWGLGYAEQVLGTVTVLATLLGTLLKLSNRSYNASDLKYDGKLIVDPQPGKDIYNFEASVPLEELRTKKELIFKVDSPLN